MTPGERVRRRIRLIKLRRARVLVTTTKMTLAEIADQLGYHQATISNLQRKHGWKRPEDYSGIRRIEDIETNWREIAKDYVGSEFSIAEIAKQYGVSPSTISDLMKRHGVRGRRAGRANGTAIVKGAATPLERVKKCQYPMWGDTTPPISEIDQHFCGKQAKDGSSYCAEHHALCWVKPDPQAPRVEWNLAGRNSRHGK